MQNSLKLQIQLAACSEQKEKTIWGFNSTLQWLKLPKFTNIQQKTRVWFHLSLGKKNRRFSCPRRLGWAFTAAAEASNTSEGPDEKVEASFRHSPVAPPQKKECSTTWDTKSPCGLCFLKNWKNHWIGWCAKLLKENVFFFKIRNYTSKSLTVCPWK